MLRSILLSAAAIAVAAPAFAHHGPGTFELGKTVTFTAVGFPPGVLNGAIRHSDQLHVVEHFTLDPKTFQLMREWEVEDPNYLRGKAAGRDVPVLPADAPYAEDTCKEQGFIDYSKQTSRK